MDRYHITLVLLKRTGTKNDELLLDYLGDWDSIGCLLLENCGSR